VRRFAVAVYRLLLWLRDHILRVCENPAWSTTWFVSDFTCFSLWSAVGTEWCFAWRYFSRSQGTRALGKVQEAQHFLPSTTFRQLQIALKSLLLNFFEGIVAALSMPTEYNCMDAVDIRGRPEGQVPPMLRLGWVGRRHQYPIIEATLIFFCSGRFLVLSQRNWEILCTHVKDSCPTYAWKFSESWGFAPDPTNQVKMYILTKVSWELAVHVCTYTPTGRCDCMYGVVSRLKNVWNVEKSYSFLSYCCPHISAWSPTC